MAAAMPRVEGDFFDVQLQLLGQLFGEGSARIPVPAGNKLLYPVIRPY